MPTTRYNAALGRSGLASGHCRATARRRLRRSRRARRDTGAGANVERATRSCRRRRASASTRWCRSCFAVAAAQPGLAAPQAVFERLLTLLETVGAAQRLPRAASSSTRRCCRASRNLMGASAWAADYLTRHPLLLDELLDARALLGRAGLGRVARASSSSCSPRSRTTPSTRWTCCAISSTRRRSACSCRTWAGMLTRGAAGRPPVRARRHRPRGALARVLDAASPVRTRRRRASRSSATASSAARSWATPPTSTSCSCSTSIPRRPDADAQETRYTRLAQRLNTWLTSTTAAGPLYDTDLRLRPDGAKGLLVVEPARLPQLPARACVDVGAPGAHPRALRRRRRARWARRSRPSARRSCACRATCRSLRAEVVAMRRQDARGASESHDAVRPQARSGRHGRRRVHRAVPGARPRARVPGLTRNVGNIALLALAGELGLVPAALAPRWPTPIAIPAAAAPGAPDRRAARARRAGRRAARRGDGAGAMDARVRRALAERRTPVGSGAKSAKIAVSPAGSCRMSMADRDGWIWYDGKMVPWRDATTHVLTHTLHYGMGVFEGVRCYKTDQARRSSGCGTTPTGCSVRRTSIGMKIPFTQDEIDAAQLECVRENKLDPATCARSPSTARTRWASPRSPIRYASPSPPGRGAPTSAPRASKGHPRQDVVVHAPSRRTSRCAAPRPAPTT